MRKVSELEKREKDWMENEAMNNINNLETPCFIVDENDFCNNIRRFYKALRQFYSNVIISYSVKTNSLPFLLTLIDENSCHCEVVSYDEYELAKRMGIAVSHIIYNGPMKSKETFIEAVEQGAYVNIETQRELNWLLEYKGAIKGKIGIRLNINLGLVSPEDAKENQGSSRFGFSYENGEFQKAYHNLTDHGIRVDGIHVHRTSATRSLEVYKNICTYALKVVNDLKMDISYIDVGGGFYGNLVGKPDYIDYATVISESLPVKHNVTMIVEPGNALIASAVKFVTSVIDNKYIGDDIILDVDGSRLDIDPFFHKKKYKYDIVSESKENCDKRQIVAGCTCLENDIITELNYEKKIQVGDKIIFHDVGAYTMTLTPNFIRLLPRVYIYDGENYVEERKPETVSNWTAASRLQPGNLKPGILFSNAGRRATLIKDFKKSLGNSVKVIATDNWCVAPALFVADEYYVTPKITDKNYINHLIDICKKENIKAVTTCIDPEIELLARNRDLLLRNGIIPLCPDQKTAELCFDKYKMFRYLKAHGIKTVETFENLDDFDDAFKRRSVAFPVFIKPRCGSGSVGIAKINSYEELKERIEEEKYDYIIQEYMDCEDFDADVYVDVISNKAVAAFSKKKIETRIGGASKTISFKDEKLFRFIQEIVSIFRFCGPVDMDFFSRNGEYYLSEINPRFGGAYLHAYGAGVDFPKLIKNNMDGIENPVNIGNYQAGNLMIMYDDVVFTTEKELRGDYND